MKRFTAHRTIRILLSLLVIAAAFSGGRVLAQDQRPIQACATLADLGSLLREIGGEQISVTTFTRGPENPHFIEAKPSFVKAASEADLYVIGGMDMEIGYTSVIIQNSRNGSILPGNRGYVDASRVIDPLGVPTGPVDRSQGDVHAAGNPHYLLDPLNGLKVAALLRDKLTDLRPAKKAYFDGRYADFRARLGAAMVGEALAKKHEFEKLTLLAEHGKLADFLKSQNEQDLLGGWLGTMLPHYGTKYADEHDLWVYFARRFGLQGIGHMEPVPGVPPTTRQIGILVERMRAEQADLILSVPYYDPKHARFLAGKTGAKIATLAHQVGALPGADDYISMFDANVNALTTALGGG